MIPGFFLILLFAYLYQHFGKAKLTPLFLFITPVVAALIVSATHRLGTNIIQSYRNLLPLTAAIILTLLKIHFIIIFFIAAFWENLWVKNKKKLAIILCSFLIALSIFIKMNFSNQETEKIIQTSQNKSSIFLTGLKGGMLSFGGAYTTIPVLEKDMINKYDNITRETFMDSLAVDSIIPSPLIIFSTFLGYIASGLIGAVLITIGIFLPAFLFSIIGFEYLEKIIENKTLHSALEGVATSVVGLFIVTTLQILADSLTTILALAIFAVSLFLFYKVKRYWITPIIFAGLAGLCSII